MLKNKVAVVTGGTRGIGYEIVRLYLENGAKVILCGSSEKSASAAVDKLKKDNNTYEVFGLGLDLKNPEEIKKEFEGIKAKLGSLDILVNNAGISHSQSIYEYDPKDFEDIMSLNVNSVFFCSQAAARIMKEQGGGCILNTSSMVSKYGQPSGCGYPTSKFAVNGLTLSLARELGRDNIRVNAVAPGITNTDMVKALPKEMMEPLIKSIPLGRIGQPEDVANMFVFLASDKASYISGQVISVDGLMRV